MVQTRLKPTTRVATKPHRHHAHLRLPPAVILVIGRRSYPHLWLHAPPWTMGPPSVSLLG